MNPYLPEMLRLASLFLFLILQKFVVTVYFSFSFHISLYGKTHDLVVSSLPHVGSPSFPIIKSLDRPRLLPVFLFGLVTQFLRECNA